MSDDPMPGEDPAADFNADGGPPPEDLGNFEEIPTPADFQAPEPVEEAPAPKAPPPPPPPPPGSTQLKPGTGVRRPTGSQPKADTQKRTRPTFVQPPAPPSKVKKILVISIPICIAALVGIGFATGKWQILLKRMGVIKTGSEDPKPTGDPAAPGTVKKNVKPLDAKYDEACAVWTELEKYVGEKLDVLEKRIQDKEAVSTADLETVVADLGNFQKRMRQGSDDIETVAAEVNKPGKSALSDLKKETVNESQMKYAQSLKDLNQIARKWKDKLEEMAGGAATADPRYDAQKAHQFGNARQGHWVRHKIEGTVAGQKKVTYRDLTVSQVFKGGITLGVKEGVNSHGQTMKWAAAEAKVVGEQALEIGGTTHKVLAVNLTQTGVVTHRWIALDGPGAGRLDLKREQGDMKSTATAIRTESFQLKGATYPCTVVTYRQEGPAGATVEVETWYSFDVLGNEVRKMSTQGADSIVEELIDLGTDLASLPPLPGAVASARPTPTAVPDEKLPMRRPDPWAGKPVGFWIRYRTTYKNKSGETEAFSDNMLKTREAVAFTYVQQDWNGAEAGPEATTNQPTPESLQLKVVGEEKLTVGDREVVCQVEEMTQPGIHLKLWFDPSMPEVPVKSETTAEYEGKPLKTTIRILKVTTEALEAAGRIFDCRLYEQEISSALDKITERMWWSADCPWGTVKRIRTSVVAGMETVATTELVATGDNWDRRLPPMKTVPKEPPKPTAEERIAKARQALADAEKLIKDASLSFKEVRAIIDENKLPTDKAGLAALLKKAKMAREKLSDANVKYDMGREASDDLSKLRATQKQVDLVIERLDGYIKTIQDKMK